MTQILHFTDYGVSRKGLDRWLEIPIPIRIMKETGHSPLLFVDSGGYRLLYNTGLDIDKYGLSAAPEEILQLQSRFGGHMVATLDYPLRPGLEDSEAEDRIRKTLANCLRAAKYADKFLNGGHLVQMAVHGRTRPEARATVERLIGGLREEGLEEIPFGIAIGSLVPLANSPIEVIDIVRGVWEGIHGCDWLDARRIPVHAFGVSSRMIPFLAAMGVDSFDGTSYVQQALALHYVEPRTFSIKQFLELNKLSCECEYCELLEDGGLLRSHRILKGKSFGEVEFAGRKTNKSFVYALLALHNLRASFGIVERTRKAASSEPAFEELFAPAAHDPRMRRALAHFSRYYPELSHVLMRVGLSRMRSRFENSSRASNRLEPALVKATMLIRPNAPPHKKASLALTPDDFDVTRFDYWLPRRKILLLLPCSQQKPYSSSPTHRFVKKTLEKAGVGSDAYSKVTISGNFGPVPEEFELDSRVQSYDFYLSSSDGNRIQLLVERTRRFLVAQEGRYDTIVAYCTAKPYRMVLEEVLDSFSNGVLLPTPLKARRASQFRKPENASQLVACLTRLSGSERSVSSR